MLGALVALFVVSGANAQTGTNVCHHRYAVAEFRMDAKRVYHQPDRVKPHQLYRLNHLRLCAVSYNARQAMNRIQLRQRKTRIQRRARAERQCGAPPCNRRLGQHMAARRGWTGQQWGCLDTLWGGRESGWRTDAHNPSGAHGIPQALPGSKMGPGWESDARVQIRWGLGYIAGRYGTPCGALAHSYATNWY